MMAKSASNAQQLKDSLRCPKCHGQEAVVRRVSLSTSPIPGFLPLVSGKFHAVQHVLFVDTRNCMMNVLMRNRLRNPMRSCVQRRRPDIVL